MGLTLIRVGFKWKYWSEIEKVMNPFKNDIVILKYLYSLRNDPDIHVIAAGWLID